MNSLNEITAINMVVRTRLKIKKNKINKIENFGLPFNYLSPFQFLINYLSPFHFLIIFTYLFLILLSYYSITSVVFSFLNVNLTIYINIERIYIQSKLSNINNKIIFYTIILHTLSIKTNS